MWFFDHFTGVFWEFYIPFAEKNGDLDEISFSQHGEVRRKEFRKNFG